MLPFLSGHASFFENLYLIFCSAFDKLREEMSKLTFVIISIVKDESKDEILNGRDE